MKNFIFKILFVFLTVFMVCIPAFANSDNTDNEPRKVEYKYIDISKYDVNDLTSFRALTKQFQKDFDKKRGTKEAEDAYLEIMDYYDDFVYKQHQNINVDRIFNYAGERYDKYHYCFYPFGLNVKYDDGGSYLTISHKYINEHFAPYLSQEWQDLMKFRVYFDKIVFFDARYAVPKSEVKQIIQFYSYFCKKYPKFSEKYGIYDSLKFFQDSLKYYPQLY